MYHHNKNISVITTIISKIITTSLLSNHVVLLSSAFTQEFWELATSITKILGGVFTNSISNIQKSIRPSHDDERLPGASKARPQLNIEGRSIESMEERNHHRLSSGSKDNAD